MFSELRQYFWERYDIDDVIFLAGIMLSILIVIILFAILAWLFTIPPGYTYTIEVGGSIYAANGYEWGFAYSSITLYDVCYNRLKCMDEIKIYHYADVPITITRSNNDN